MILAIRHLDVNERETDDKDKTKKNYRQRRKKRKMVKRNANRLSFARLGQSQTRMMKKNEKKR